MERTQFVPELVWQLTDLGEKTGDLAPMMDNIFSFYKKKCIDGIEVLMAVLKPALLFFSAGLVLLMAGAIFIPLFKLGSNIKRD